MKVPKSGIPKLQKMRSREPNVSQFQIFSNLQNFKFSTCFVKFLQESETHIFPKCPFLRFSQLFVFLYATTVVVAAEFADRSVQRSRRAGGELQWKNAEFGRTVDRAHYGCVRFPVLGRVGVPRVLSERALAPREAGQSLRANRVHDGNSKRLFE